MNKPSTLYIGGTTDSSFVMDAKMANRHGLIAGATGTGKTITLQNGISRSHALCGNKIYD